MIQFGEFTLDNFQLLMLRHTVYHSELLQRAPVDMDKLEASRKSSYHISWEFV